MLTRRRLLISATAALASAAFVRTAAAAQPLEVAVASNALGAIVAATGGAAVAIVLDRTLGPAEIRLAGVVHSTAGTSRVRPGHLDDARNAPRLGASVRKILAAALPDQAAEFDANHRTWTHDFVRRVLAWNARLAGSPVRGKRIADTSQRAVLLEWAGAVVDPAGGKPPAALSGAPRDAAAATLDGYVAYIDALVRSVS